LRPSDKIDKDTWDHIVTLADDVAIRTTNQHGKAIKQISDLTYEWLIHSDERDRIMLPVMLDAYDNFEAALYTAITGYYRLSHSSVRSALELVTIGTWAKVCGKRNEFQNWQKGKIELSLGGACDGLIGATLVLRNALKVRTNDSLFDQRTGTIGGGYVRRTFSRMSDFSHARPGFTDSSMRKSNGPIYVRKAFNDSLRVQTETMGLLFVLSLIANPKTRFNQIVIDLFADRSKIKSCVTRAAFRILHS
jgi:hypothetical protein